MMRSCWHRILCLRWGLARQAGLWPGRRFADVGSGRRFADVGPQTPGLQAFSDRGASSRRAEVE